MNNGSSERPNLTVIKDGMIAIGQCALAAEQSMKLFAAQTIEAMSEIAPDMRFYPADEEGHDDSTR